MIKDSDGDVFEEMRTVEQGLTFQEAEEAFARYHVDSQKINILHWACEISMTISIQT